MWVRNREFSNLSRTTEDAWVLFRGIKPIALPSPSLILQLAPQMVTWNDHPWMGAWYSIPTPSSDQNWQPAHGDIDTSVLEIAKRDWVLLRGRAPGEWLTT